MEITRIIAVALIDTVIEPTLYRASLWVPDRDREGDETESALYGETYYQVEDGLVQYLQESYPKTMAVISSETAPEFLNKFQATIDNSTLKLYNTATDTLVLEVPVEPDPRNNKKS